MDPIMDIIDRHITKAQAHAAEISADMTIHAEDVAIAEAPVYALTQLRDEILAATAPAS